MHWEVRARLSTVLRSSFKSQKCVWNWLWCPFEMIWVTGLMCGSRHVLSLVLILDSELVQLFELHPRTQMKRGSVVPPLQDLEESGSVAQYYFTSSRSSAGQDWDSFGGTLVREKAWRAPIHAWLSISIHWCYLPWFSWTLKLMEEK